MSHMNVAKPRIPISEPIFKLKVIRSKRPAWPLTYTKGESCSRDSSFALLEWIRTEMINRRPKALVNVRKDRFWCFQCDAKLNDHRDRSEPCRVVRWPTESWIRVRTMLLCTEHLIVRKNIRVDTYSTVYLSCISSRSSSESLHQTWAFHSVHFYSLRQCPSECRYERLGRSCD